MTENCPTCKEEEEEEEEDEEEENDNSDYQEMEEDDNTTRTSGRERLGSYIKRDSQEQSMESFEDYLGLEADSLIPQGRKRKHDEVDISSNSNSPEYNSQSLRPSEDKEESNGENELAELLGM